MVGVGNAGQGTARGGQGVEEAGVSPVSYYDGVAGLAAAVAYVARTVGPWLSSLDITITSIEEVLVLLVRLYWPLTTIALLAAILLPLPLALAPMLDPSLRVRWPEIFDGEWPSLTMRFCEVLRFTASRLETSDTTLGELAAVADAVAAMPRCLKQQLGDDGLKQEERQQVRWSARRRLHYPLPSLEKRIGA